MRVNYELALRQQKAGGGGGGGGDKDPQPEPQPQNSQTKRHAQADSGMNNSAEQLLDAVEQQERMLGAQATPQCSAASSERSGLVAYCRGFQFYRAR